VQLLHQERKSVGGLVDLLGRRLAGSMSRFCLDPDEDRIGARLICLHRRHELEGVAGNDSIVADAASPLNSSLRLLFTLDERTGIHDLFELRRILDCEAAALAAERRTDKHLEEMGAAIDEMDASLGTSGRADDFIDADLRFHLAVAEATGNRLLLHSMQAVRDVVRRALMTVFFIPQSPEQALVEHRAVRRAIAAGDGPRARQEMFDHLVRVETDVEKGVANG